MYLDVHNSKSRNTKNYMVWNLPGWEFCHFFSKYISLKFNSFYENNGMIKQFIRDVD